jgi:hypothetical protein
MRKLLTFLILLYATFLPLHGDIKSFQEDVEAAEEQVPEKETTPESIPESAKHRQKTFGDILMELTFLLWFHHNASTTFSPHPYHSTGFVRWAEERQSGVRLPTGTKDHWLSAEVQALGLDGLGWGAWTGVKGHLYRFFGPYLEAWNLNDGKENLTGFRVGALLALFQSDPLSLGVYGQWNHWTGAFSRTGGTVGLEVRSYPFAPLTLQSRWGVQVFPQFQMGEGEVQAGLTRDSWEAFAGWRWWTLRTAEGSPVNRYGGPFAGIRKYF